MKNRIFLSIFILSLIGNIYFFYTTFERTSTLTQYTYSNASTALFGLTAAHTQLQSAAESDWSSSYALLFAGAFLQVAAISVREAGRLEDYAHLRSMPRAEIRQLAGFEAEIRAAWMLTVTQAAAIERGETPHTAALQATLDALNTADFPRSPGTQDFNDPAFWQALAAANARFAAEVEPRLP
jgi:hypothetical protein